MKASGVKKRYVIEAASVQVLSKTSLSLPARSDPEGTAGPVPTGKLRITFLLSLLMVFHNGVNDEAED